MLISESIYSQKFYFYIKKNKKLDKKNCTKSQLEANNNVVDYVIFGIYNETFKPSIYK